MKSIILHQLLLIKIHDVISATVETDETNEAKRTEVPKKMTKKSVRKRLII